MMDWQYPTVKQQCWSVPGSLPTWLKYLKKMKVKEPRAPVLSPWFWHISNGYASFLSVLRARRILRSANFLVEYTMTWWWWTVCLFHRSQTMPNLWFHRDALTMWASDTLVMPTSVQSFQQLTGEGHGGVFDEPDCTGWGEVLSLLTSLQNILHQRANHSSVCDKTHCSEVNHDEKCLCSYHCRLSRDRSKKRETPTHSYNGTRSRWWVTTGGLHISERVDIEVR